MLCKKPLDKAKIGEPVDSYIVRIYRREKDNPRMLVGLIEEIGSKGKKGFTSFDDLWEILNQRADTDMGKGKQYKTKKDAE